MPKDTANLMGLSPESASSHERKKLEPTQRGLTLLNPEGKDADEIEKEIRGRSPRSQYAPMQAHKELASQVLAVGGTQTMAARYAGVNKRQIRKYMMDPQFRARVEEHRSVMASRIKGRIMTEISRRTNRKMIKNLEVMDLMRILDRLSGSGGRGMTTIIEGDVNVNKYEGVLAALFAPDALPDGADFPSYEDQNTIIPGTSTPVD